MGSPESPGTAGLTQGGGVTKDEAPGAEGGGQPLAGTRGPDRGRRPCKQGATAPVPPGPGGPDRSTALSRGPRGFIPLCPRVGATSPWEAQRPSTFLFLQKPERPSPVRAPHLGSTTVAKPPRPPWTSRGPAFPRPPGSPWTPRTLPSLPSQTDPHCQPQGPRPTIDRAPPSGTPRLLRACSLLAGLWSPCQGRGMAAHTSPSPATLAPGCCPPRGRRGLPSRHRFAHRFVGPHDLA